MSRRIASVVLCAALAACRPAQLPRQVVVLADGSKSLPEATRTLMIATLKDVAKSIGRGDELIIIPISGFAAAETPGHILRFRVKLQREPFDSDRAKFADDVAVAANALLAQMIDSPSLKTDILGAWEFAAQELGQSSEFDRRIICLSDFLQDDQRFVFKRDEAVSNPTTAKRTARQLAQQSAGRLAGVKAFLGVVQSTESWQLTQSRREGVRTFWLEYLSTQGAQVIWKDDGLGLVARFARSNGVDVVK